MRILHLVNRIEDNGNGITNVALDLACEQARQGHEVIVASKGGAFEDLLDVAGVGLVRVDFNQRRPLAMIRAFIDTRRVMRVFAPDVAHAHTITAAAIAAAAAPRVRLVATVHNEYQRGVSVMRVADVVVGVSRSVTSSATRWARKGSMVRTVYNGVLGSARRGNGSAATHPVSPRTIVTIGAVSRRKGSDLLLDAFEEVDRLAPGAELLFVGNVDWPEELERRAGQPYMDRVRFAGYDAQPQRYLARGTIFVMASRRDPFPLALLEAMGAGCAIIGTEVDGIPEALDGGACGLVVPPEDPHRLAEAIIALLEQPRLRAGYADAALQASQRYTVGHMASEYLALYTVDLNSVDLRE